MKIWKSLALVVCLSGFSAHAETVNCSFPELSADMNIEYNENGGATLTLSGLEALVWQDSYRVFDTLGRTIESNGRKHRIQGLMRAEVPRNQVLSLIRNKTRVKNGILLRNADSVTVEFDKCIRSKTDAVIGSCYVTKKSERYQELGIRNLRIDKVTTETADVTYTKYVAKLNVNSGLNGIEVELPGFSDSVTSKGKNISNAARCTNYWKLK